MIVQVQEGVLTATQAYVPTLFLKSCYTGTGTWKCLVFYYVLMETYSIHHLLSFDLPYVLRS